MAITDVPDRRARSNSDDGRRSGRRRTSPGTFVREIRDEMRQVAWPSRAEMLNYTAVVLTTLVLMISLIFVLNYAYGKAILFLFHK